MDMCRNSEVQSTRQEGSLLQLTAIWEQLWEQKKGRRIAQAWVNIKGGLRVVCFFHSGGWTPRNEALHEAVVKQAKTTRHPWLEAGDANTCPENFEKSAHEIEGSECMQWLRKKRPHAGQKAQKVSGLKEHMTTSLRETILG